MTNDEIVKHSWHWVIEDKLGYEFAANILAQDGLISHEDVDLYIEKIKIVFMNISLIDLE